MNICYLCKMAPPSEMHHIMHGTANRKIADQYGLVVPLCQSCHRKLHNKGIGYWELKRQAQEWFESDHTHAEWMQAFGRNYL